MPNDYDNSGILTKNERKQQPKHPDYKGSITVNGEEFWLSAWIKKGERGKLAGKTFMSLSVEPKEQRQAPPQQQKSTPPPAAKAEDIDEDVPF